MPSALVIRPFAPFKSQMALWRVRYKLNLCGLTEMFLQRGIAFTRETVRHREAQLAPVLTELLRQKRRDTVSESWYVDKTYLRAGGRWQYLYRAIARNGNLVDVRLSDTKDLTAAEVFSRSARTVAGVTPERITTDGHDAYPRAIRRVFGERVTHRTDRDFNNHVELDHRGIKQRSPPTGGFKHGTTAARFCEEEVLIIINARAR